MLSGFGHVCENKRPLPNLGEKAKQAYSEAKAILDKSPRGAAALFRLCLQRLFRQLGCEGRRIGTSIY